MGKLRAAAAGGSSPLARGLQDDNGPVQRVDRIIPARAGFTHRILPRPRRRGDHPRSRGVYVERPPRLTQSLGSSPLARGLLCSCHLRARRGRIIPARAGFTDASSHGNRQGADHPRSRGVYSHSWFTSHSHGGSSPLARGLHVVLCGRGVVGRIIPARAGFTRYVLISEMSLEDHPRSRGVYGPTALGEKVSVGSSPLARGLHW